MRTLEHAVMVVSFAALVGCATTKKETSSEVKTGGTEVTESSGPAKPGKTVAEQAQPQINTRAKLAFEDANKAWEAQKKSGKVDYPQLQHKYQQAIDADPALAEAEYDLGVLAERQGNKDEAVAHYKAALRKKPTLKEAAENLAVISQNAGDVPGAVKVYTDILQHYPDDASSRARLAEIYRQQNDVDRALDLAKQALVRDPKSLTAYKVMMLSYLDKHQLSLAKLIALRAIKLDDQDPELYNAMGLILVAEKDPEKALLQFKKAVEVRPDYLPAHVVLAKISLDKENYAEAEEHLRKMLQVDSKNAAVHVDLGVVYKGLGQFDKAMAEYDVAEKLSPELPAVYLNRAIILHRFKNAPDKAIDLYKKYIALAGAGLGTDHPVYKLLEEAQQLIEADKQAKQMEEEQKKIDAQQKANEAKAKQEADAKKSEGQKGGVAAEAAGDKDGPPDAKTPTAGGSEKGSKGELKPASGTDKKDVKPASGKGTEPSSRTAPAETKPAPQKAAPAPPPAKPNKPADEPSDEPM